LPPPLYQFPRTCLFLQGFSQCVNADPSDPFPLPYFFFLRFLEPPFNHFPLIPPVPPNPPPPPRRVLLSLCFIVLSFLMKPIPFKCGLPPISLFFISAGLHFWGKNPAPLTKRPPIVPAQNHHFFSPRLRRFQKPKSTPVNSLDLSPPPWHL